MCVCACLGVLGCDWVFVCVFGYVLVYLGMFGCVWACFGYTSVCLGVVGPALVCWCV